MSTSLSFWLGEPIYIAGDVVPPGVYHEIGMGCTVTLERAGRLPFAMGSQMRSYVADRDSAAEQHRTRFTDPLIAESPGSRAKGAKR